MKVGEKARRVAGRNKTTALPEGHEDRPVRGVGWYEAAAYAAFAGKCLPTVYHWSLAAGDPSHVAVGFVIPLGNYEQIRPMSSCDRLRISRLSRWLPIR